MAENNNRRGPSLDEIEAQELEELAEKKKRDKKRFNPFTRAFADGKGVAEDEELITADLNFKNFFKLLGRKINQLLSVNAFIIFGNFPIFFILFALSGYVSEHSTAPYHQIFPALSAVMNFDSSPVTAALYGIFGTQVEISVITTAIKVFYGLGALTLLTFGPVNAGITYILRSIVRGEPLFMWSDFWYTVKKNLKQALPFGFLDLLLMAFLAYDAVYFYYNLQVSFMVNVMFYLTLFMIIVYFFTRMYIYTMMITFDMKLTKIIKNALIFSVLGVKRNLMALLGIAAVVFLNYFLYALFMPLGIILPFVLTFAVGTFVCMYASYPNIKKYMIDRDGSDLEAEIAGNVN